MSQKGSRADTRRYAVAPLEAVSGDPGAIKGLPAVYNGLAAGPPSSHLPPGFGRDVTL